MNGTLGISLLGAFALAVLLGTGPAAAFEDEQPGWQSMSTTELASHRAMGDNSNSGSVHHNIVIEGGNMVYADGGLASNLIDNGAFANARGMITILQNNGHSAIVSNAISVAITVNP